MSRVRDHWSIGEVLSLLQDEFPEVTISKIRFLESQGLIDPERTPSGYRKFSDSDYDRLYWILEQQRDHYLPLRVIRDRLEEGQEIAPAPRRGDARIGDEIDDDESEGQEMTDDEIAVGVTPEPPQPPAGYAAETDPDAESEQTFAEAMAGREGPIAATDPNERHPVRDADANALADLMAEQVEPAVSDSPETSQTEVIAVTEEHPESEGQEAPTSGEVPPAPADDAGSIEPPPATETTNGHEAGDDAAPRKPAPRLLGTRTEPPRPVTKSPSEALAPPPRPSLPGSSVALTRDELAEQSGCTPGMVAELEKHGLISPRRVGTAILFDSTALTIARLAVQFGRYGLEPRHLRTFRLGAEREVALLTQSIGPTLKANNPETRRRSFDTLQDLAELSASLRSIIVRDLVADLEPG